MINDLNIIQAVDDLYNQKPVFDYIINICDAYPYVGVKYVEGNTIVIYRGSTTKVDWARDLFAVPHDSVNDPRLGDLHEGFSLGFERTVAALKPLIQGSLILGGHSLGAAEALIGAGEFIEEGMAPISVVVFGEPKPGFQRLADVLEPLTIRSYKNCEDLVTHVPCDILGMDYVHPRALLQLNESPPDNDPWGILADHHSELYLNGIRKLPQIPIIIQ
jgi:predicted lipase